MSASMVRCCPQPIQQRIQGTSLLVLHEQEVAESLGIPDDVSQTVLLPVGYMKDAVLKRAKRKPPAEVTYWEHWGEPRG